MTTLVPEVTCIHYTTEPIIILPGLLFLVRSHGCVVVRWKSLRSHTRKMSSLFHAACHAKCDSISNLAATYIRPDSTHRHRQMCSDRKGQANVCHSDMGTDLSVILMGHF